ncbi:MAG TPA: hypothetical protein VFM21_07925 [Terriglobia bacterium]|nr:hypothetical protein [Terriglobia bacterium]
MRKIWLTLAASLGMAIVIGIGGEVVMHLWNWNLPAIFGWREITFWQALGLFALCRILFGDLGMRFGGSHRANFRRRIEERMAERWEKMTPEERERARQSWRGRWGFCPPTGETKQP